MKASADRTPETENPPPSEHVQSVEPSPGESTTDAQFTQPEVRSVAETGMDACSLLSEDAGRPDGGLFPLAPRRSSGLQVEQRNDQIIKYFQDNKWSPPGDKTIRRWFKLNSQSKAR